MTALIVIAISVSMIVAFGIGYHVGYCMAYKEYVVKRRDNEKRRRMD